MHDMIIAVALKAIHPILIAAPPTLYADLTVTFPIHSARKEVDTVTATSGTAGHNLRTCYTTRRAQFPFYLRVHPELTANIRVFGDVLRLPP